MSVAGRGARSDPVTGGRGVIFMRTEQKHNIETEQQRSMTIRQWDDSLLVGIEAIDDQHRQLFDIMEKVRGLIPTDSDNPEVGGLLKEMITLTQAHFRDEERLMEEMRFPDRERHKRLHRDISARIVAMLEKLKAGEDFGAKDLLEFIERWQIEHVQAEDARIGRAMKAKRIRAGR